MKKTLLALSLMIASTSVFADAGLFFDGTSKYARTGVIQSNFPDVQLVSCPNFKACDRFLVDNLNIGIVYSDAAKMKAEVKRRASAIVSITPIHTVPYKGFKITVTDIVDDEGRSFVMLGVKTAKKKTTKAQNMAIAEALVDEITDAYFRLEQSDDGTVGINP